MKNIEALPQAVAENLERVLQQALEHHCGGQFEEAGQAYRAILDCHPEHAQANHCMGILAVQLKQAEAGLPYFVAALNADPSREQYWLSYIEALCEAGQRETAREVLMLARQHGLEGAATDALARRVEAGEPLSGGTANFGQSQAPTPSEVDALVALLAARRYAEVEKQARDMTLNFPRHWVGWKMLGVVLVQMGRSADALLPMQAAATLLPNDAETHNNLGIVFQNLDRLAEAETSYRRALQIQPGYYQAHSNLGSTLQALERLDEAETSYRHALQINPDYARAYSNLGTTLLALGRFDEAATICRRSLQISPQNAETHYNLGLILKNLGNLSEAEASYRQALQIQPGFPDALNNLAMLFAAQGQWMMALSTIRKSLSIKETTESKSIFVACVRRLKFTHYDQEMRALLVRALREPWSRPAELASVCSELIKRDGMIGEFVARAVSVWPTRLSVQDLLESDGFSVLAADSLLDALLEAAPICDMEMERLLTMVRCALLDTVVGITPAADRSMQENLDFFSALARQCFINEYVFTYTDDEILKATALRDALAAALDAHDQAPVLWLLVVASYFPLHSIACAHRLLEQQWPASVAAVLIQQVLEPAEELQLRASIPCLTSMADEVSHLVQAQYEESPYPRWVKIAPAGKAKNIGSYLRQKFPLVPLEGVARSGRVGILVAGCGTGQHSIGTVQRILDAQVLAVDLSMSSLSYAKRKTRELGATAIEYAQADLLKLGALGRHFDVIESVGVLHHLADPWAGWAVLLSLLRPGGFMKLGLYSEAARHNVVRIRAWIAAHGYGARPDEIRRCRQDLMDLDASADFGMTLRSPDFFSTSACRDLLFHVQEQRMTLSAIHAFLDRNALQFLGFDMESDLLEAYRLRFPDDREAIDLEQWQVFENENPDTFAGMYQFWIRKQVEKS